LNFKYQFRSWNQYHLPHHINFPTKFIALVIDQYGKLSGITSMTNHLQPQVFNFNWQTLGFWVLTLYLILNWPLPHSLVYAWAQNKRTIMPDCEYLIPDLNYSNISKVSTTSFDQKLLDPGGDIRSFFEKIWWLQGSDFLQHLCFIHACSGCNFFLDFLRK
jgi:hypothetical protein